VDETEDATSIYIREQVHSLCMTIAYVAEQMERGFSSPPQNVMADRVLN
jgi:hypothetical protein